MSSISTLEVAWENKSLWPRWERKIFLRKLLKRINSSCSSGRERRNKCKWDEWTINTAAGQGNLEMVKYCVANECPIDVEACACAARYGHLEVPQILTRRSRKRLGIGDTANLAAENGHLHILEYLVERKYDKYRRKCVLVCSRVRPLGLFEVLTRNRQSALEL